MATVISLTEEKIKDLLAGWEGVALSQDDINALVLQLRELTRANDAKMVELHEQTLPQLQTDLDASSVRVSELNDVVLPDLRADLDNATLSLQNVVDIDIPTMRQDLTNTSQLVIEKPKVYVQPDAPTNPDIDDRDLVVGDTWFDSDDNNTHRIWNGVEWTNYKVDIADFSLTVKKFMTNTHQIY